MVLHGFISLDSLVPQLLAVLVGRSDASSSAALGRPMFSEVDLRSWSWRRVSSLRRMLFHYINLLMLRFSGRFSFYCFQGGEVGVVISWFDGLDFKRIKGPIHLGPLLFLFLQWFIGLFLEILRIAD